MSRVSKGAMNGIMECHTPLSIQQERSSTLRKSDKYHSKITPIKKRLPMIDGLLQSAIAVR